MSYVSGLTTSNTIGMQTVPKLLTARLLLINSKYEADGDLQSKKLLLENSILAVFADAFSDSDFTITEHYCGNYDSITRTFSDVLTTNYNDFIYNLSDVNESYKFARTICNHFNSSKSYTSYPTCGIHIHEGTVNKCVELHKYKLIFLLDRYSKVVSEINKDKVKLTQHKTMFNLIPFVVIAVAILYSIKFW